MEIVNALQIVWAVLVVCVVFFTGGGGLRSRMSPIFSCAGGAGSGVALVGGMVLAAFRTVPVDEDAVAVLAACVDLQ